MLLLLRARRVYTKFQLCTCYSDTLKFRPDLICDCNEEQVRMDGQTAFPIILYMGSRRIYVVGQTIMHWST
jgi:hypothetical protein